jgi:DNA-directed RNA polymerase specialized sigma24 family protein
VSASPAERFTAFVEDVGPRIQHALMAALGPDVGADAAADALAYGWQHWDRIEPMHNPAGYLYRVGRSRGARRPAWTTVDDVMVVDDASAPWVEPGLAGALTELSERQRVSTLLVYGGGWTLAEVADLLGVDRGSVKKHADRGLAKLRAALEVSLDG